MHGALPSIRWCRTLSPTPHIPSVSTVGPHAVLSRAYRLASRSPIALMQGLPTFRVGLRLPCAWFGDQTGLTWQKDDVSGGEHWISRLRRKPRLPGLRSRSYFGGGGGDRGAPQERGCFCWSLLERGDRNPIGGCYLTGSSSAISSRPSFDRPTTRSILRVPSTWSVPVAPPRSPTVVNLPSLIANRP